MINIDDESLGSNRLKRRLENVEIQAPQTFSSLTRYLIRNGLIIDSSRLWRSRFRPCTS